jgi:hypothetical protein
MKEPFLPVALPEFGRKTQMGLGAPTAEEPFPLLTAAQKRTIRKVRAQGASLSVEHVKVLGISHPMTK